LYRGAQPTEEGIKQLKALGVKTIVNLRSLHGDPIGDTNGVTGVAIATQPWDVEPEDVAIQASADQPVGGCRSSLVGALSRPSPPENEQPTAIHHCLDQGLDLLPDRLEQGLDIGRKRGQQEGLVTGGDDHASGSPLVFQGASLCAMSRLAFSPVVGQH
jgi:hypothetical protein